MTLPSHPSREPRRGLTRLETAVLGLFFLSGASALVYEVVWSRELTNVFGGSAFAISTVLASFMAGLALGSALAGRFIDRRGNPLAVYALLEGGIAVWALLIPVLFALLDRLYVGLSRSLEPGFYTLSLVRFVLSFLVLLVPTTLMGGTLPVLGKFLFTAWNRLGERAGILYAANTLGAVLGTAGGGFVLLPALGLHGTTLVAAGANVAVALLALGLSRGLRVPAPDAPPRAERPKSRPPHPPLSPGLGKAILWAYAASGFAALAYEVAWTKTLSCTLGTTTYAFTSMLVTFLLGLSLGSLLFAKLADRTGRPVNLLAAVLIAIPVFTLGTIPLMGHLPQFFLDGFRRVSHEWFALELYRILLAASTMFIPTLLMGGTFPLVTRVYVGPDRTATRLGKLYAANTVGAIFGSFVAGFILIPWVGRQYSIFAAAMVNILAAVLLLAVVGRRGSVGTWKWAFAALSVLLLGGVAAGARPWDIRLVDSGAYLYAARIPKDSTVVDYMGEQNLIFHGESAEASVSVWSADYITALRINGKIDASSHGDMVTQKMLAHLPALYHREGTEDALVIGLASGISSGVLLQYPAMTVSTVDIVPAIVTAARYFKRFNHDCLDNPRHQVIINDGRNYLALTDRKFDVMVSEPSNPWIAGLGSLFTREFFDLTKRRLRPGGVYCQWVQTYEYQEADLKTMLGTLLDAYPHLALWSGAPGDLIVIGSEDPLVLDLDRVRDAIAGDPGKDLASFGILPLPQLLALYVTDREGVKEFVGDWKPRVTDDNLYLEYSVPRHMFQEEGRVDVTTLEPVARSIVPSLTGSGIDSTLTARIENYRRAHEIALRVRLRGELPAGATSPEEAYRTALAIAPGEVSATSFLSHDLNEQAIHDLAPGDTAAAIARFREVVRLAYPEERALALNDLGLIAFQRGQVDSAGRLWEAAIRDEPDHPVILYNLALIADGDGRRDEAVRYYRRVLARKDDHLGALNNLAFDLALAGESLDEAERCARKAVSLDDSANNRDTLGYVLVKRGRWKEAESILSGIVERNPSDWESLYHLALAQAGGGNQVEARSALEKVVTGSRNPDLVSRAQAELRKL